MNNGYRDLDVYGLAHDIGVDIHEFSLKLPKYELYETGSQLRRASKSISANIVEGYGRKRYNAEFLKFLVYAFAMSKIVILRYKSKQNTCLSPLMN